MEAALIEVLKGVPVAAVLFYFAVQFRNDLGKLQDRHEKLVDRTIESFSKQSYEMSAALSNAQKVMERVEGKLDGKH
jgi:hypothetical protein